MTQCAKQSKNTVIITQISEKEYLIESKNDWVRLGCQTDLSMITSANIHNGPFLLVGDSFLGKGKIVSIYNLSEKTDNGILIKITLAS